MLRERFVADVNRRFAALKRDIRLSIVDEDCFGIQPQVMRIYTLESTIIRRTLRVASPTPRKAFEFVRTPQKVSRFMTWLEEQEALGVLERVHRPGTLTVESAWTDTYIDSAYQRGIRQGRAELRKIGVSIPTLEEVPGGVGALMNQPLHADRVGIIFSRTYEDLKSVTNVMNAQSRRMIERGLTSGLARGIAEGKNPRRIARELYADVANRVNKIGITRTRMIARTEVLNAHNEALDAEYQRAEREIGLPILVDVSLGANPCDICVGLYEDGPYPLAEARGQLPAHPNCVCVHIPRIDRSKVA
jgi:hypothetical protein